MVARLQLARHTLTIERKRGDAFTLLAAGGSVRPEEGIRFSAHFGGFGSGWVEFSVLDAQGVTVWGPSSIEANLAGNAWEDVQAPIEPGTYTLLAAGRQGLRFGSPHPATRTFRVDPRAPAPPAGGGFDFGALFTNPWTIVAILGALIALGIMI